MRPSLRIIGFRPTLLPTLAAGVTLALTLYLATWQQDRAAEKRILQASFEARTRMPELSLATLMIGIDDLYRRAVAVGEFDSGGQIFLDNKIAGETVGYHVVTPLQLAGASRYVLVNRGFVPRGPAYPHPPVVAVPSGPVEVHGVLSAPSSKFLELGTGSTVQDSVWQNLTVDRYRQHSGRVVASLILLANPSASGLSAVVERPNAKVAKHVEYMLTWYSLAATIVVLWVAINLQFSKPDESQ